MSDTNTSKYAGATPGPWQLRSDPQRFEAIVYAPDGTFVAHVMVCDERDANARLIAAAPDLLQALLDLQKEIRGVVKFDVKKHYFLMVADAAASTIIKRARGDV